MRLFEAVPPRSLIGGAIGLIAFLVDVVATLIRLLLNPGLAERATTGALLAMFGFLFLFVAAGALAGYLWAVRSRLQRCVSIGALVGAMVWCYLTVTWPLTARPGSFIAPQASALESLIIGAIGGALGGVLLWMMDMLRRGGQR